jgi:hypothetical protein
LLKTIAILGLALACLPPISASAQADGERLVLAFYYPWYDANAWNSGTLADLPEETYNSDDPAAMSRQIAQAQSAGIDALVLNWWGTRNRTEKNLRTFLDVAAGQGFRVSVVFDINSPVMSGAQSYAANLAHLHNVHATHPAYLRYNGKPVVFFYNVSRLSVTAWAGIRDQVDPGRQAMWIAEGTDLSYQPVFDGHHLYSILWPNRIPPAQTLPKWGERVRAFNRDHGASKLWVATVMPGYDDRRVRPGSGFARSRDGGETYRQAWQAAIGSSPDWVIVNSFNEWAEGTYIEPSKTYGSLYLDLTREWSAKFKSADFVKTAPPPAPPPTTREKSRAPTKAGNAHRASLSVVDVATSPFSDSMGRHCSFFRLEDRPDPTLWIGCRPVSLGSLPRLLVD